MFPENKSCKEAESYVKMSKMKGRGWFASNSIRETSVICRCNKEKKLNEEQL